MLSLNRQIILRNFGGVWRSLCLGHAIRVRVDSVPRYQKN